jgi:hypothetical protein
VRCGDTEPAREPLHRRGFARGFRPQPVIDGDGDEFGRALEPLFDSLAQRAAMTRSAVESEPPETARIKPAQIFKTTEQRVRFVVANAWSAMATLLFSIHGLLHARRSARIFAQHFTERGAGRFLFAQSRERLAKPQQRFRRARGRLILRRNGEERLGGVAILLLLEQTFAEPVLRFRRQPVARILAQERAEGVGGERIVLVQHVAVSEIVASRGELLGGSVACMAPVPLGLAGGGGGNSPGAAPGVERSSGAPI